MTIPARLRSAVGRLPFLPAPRRYVLPRRTAGSAAYAAAGGGTWIVVEKGGAVSRRPPDHHGAQPSRLLETVVPWLPEQGTLVLDGGIVAGPTGWVMGQDRVLLKDLTWHGDDAQDMRDWQRITGREFQVRRLKGSVLTIASYSAWRNHGHFVLESLPRLHLAVGAGFALDTLDWVIASPPHAGGRRMLERLGVPLDRLIVPEEGVAYQADRLIAPSFPGLRRNSPPWSPGYLRSALVPAGVQPQRRLYLPRLRERRILNMAQLQPILDAHGFETFDPGSGTADPIGRFAEARVIVGGHGAALADVVFCAPGGAVLELLPSEHQMPYYYTAADSAGLRYGHLVGPSRLDSKAAGTKPNKIDFEVDADEFRAALEATLAMLDEPADGGAAERA